MHILKYEKLKANPVEAIEELSMSIGLGGDFQWDAQRDEKRRQKSPGHIYSVSEQCGMSIEEFYAEHKAAFDLYPEYAK